MPRFPHYPHPHLLKTDYNDFTPTPHIEQRYIDSIINMPHKNGKYLENPLQPTRSIGNKARRRHASKVDHVVGQRPVQAAGSGNTAGADRCCVALAIFLMKEEKWAGFWLPRYPHDRGNRGSLCGFRCSVCCHQDGEGMLSLHGVQDVAYMPFFALDQAGQPIQR